MARGAARRRVAEKTGSERTSWCQIRLQTYVLKLRGSKLPPPYVRKHKSGLRARGDVNRSPKTQGTSTRLGAKFGSKHTGSSLVSPSACVRAAVCACVRAAICAFVHAATCACVRAATCACVRAALCACVRAAVCASAVSEYGARTSRAYVREGGGRRMPRGATRQKTQGVSGRLGARFGSKLTPSSPVPSSSYVRARADARLASKREGARTGVRRHKGVSVRLGAKFGSKLTASSLVSPSACVPRGRLRVHGLRVRCPYLPCAGGIV